MSSFNHLGIDDVYEHMLEETKKQGKQKDLELYHIRFCWEYIENQVMSKTKHMNTFDRSVLHSMMQLAFDEHAIVLLNTDAHGNIFHKTYYVVYHLLRIVRNKFDNFLYSKENQANAELSMYIYEEAVYTTLIEVSYNICTIAA